MSADLTAAKQALQDVIDSEKYGFASTTSFADVFDVAKKDNKEMIFVVRYLLNEKKISLVNSYILQTPIW